MFGFYFYFLHIKNKKFLFSSNSAQISWSVTCAPSALFMRGFCFILNIIIIFFRLKDFHHTSMGFKNSDASSTKKKVFYIWVLTEGCMADMEPGVLCPWKCYFYCENLLLRQKAHITKFKVLFFFKILRKKDYNPGFCKI